MNVAFALIFYGASATCLVGLTGRVLLYARTPAPLKIPTTPAPLGAGGVSLRLAREIVLFESLFRANLWIWLFGWVFHFALVLVLLRHLRYFTQPIWSLSSVVQPLALFAGLAMLAGLAGLLVRRCAVARIRYISTPSDFALLILLLLIGLTGVAMKSYFHTDVVAVKYFFLGLMRLHIEPLPSDGLLYLHLLLVAGLLIIFPFSKLVHGPALLFSPTRNQSNDTRSHRHLVAWAARLDGPV